MNKKKYIILATILVIIVVAAFWMKRHIFISNDGISFSISGGADGPTSVFLAGKLQGEENETLNYTSISMDEAKDIFTEQGDYIIVDVRREDEFAEGHIPGAINIPNESIKSEPAQLPDKSQVIYVYCRSGNRSKQASEKLAELGYSSVIEFGGILDWTGNIEK